MQTIKIFIHLRNKNEDLFGEILALSVPPLTVNATVTFKVQKCSKDIIKKQKHEGE